ncbi:MAG: hypothetical protein PHS62_00255 [Patescibacteria group bacterium]|nr:hypothetical protein [Patescibacteria group bacterium]
MRENKMNFATFIPKLVANLTQVSTQRVGEQTVIPPAIQEEVISNIAAAIETQLLTYRANSLRVGELVAAVRNVTGGC